MKRKALIPGFVMWIFLCTQLPGQVVKSEKSSIRLSTQPVESETRQPATLIEPAANEKLQIRNEEAVRKTEMAGEEVRDALPPEIKLVAPMLVDDSYSTDQAELGLIGQALDESGIQLILVNAERIQYSGDGIFNLKLSLDAGINTVHIVAFDTKSNFSEKWFTIHYEPERLSLAEKLSSLVQKQHTGRLSEGNKMQAHPVDHGCLLCRSHF